MSQGKQPLRVRVVVPPETSEQQLAATHLGQLLGQSPHWKTHVGMESDYESRLEQTDVLILHAPPSRPIPNGTVRFVRLSDFGSPPSEGSKEALSSCADNSYFACTSEGVRESFLALFPGSRHRAYVVPSSFSAPNEKGTTTPENELGHWQELIRALKRRSDIPKANPVRVTALWPREISSDLSLSIVIGSEGMDKRLVACLNRVYAQIEESNAELLVGLKQVPGPETAQWPAARFFHETKGNVLSLRAKGIAMARGEIVAIMEDHGLPGKDWCRRILELHRAHPETRVIYGPVMHGGPFGITSWANFLVNYGLFMPPLDFPPRRRVPPIVGTTIKRSYLPEGEIEEGWFEFIDMPKFHDLELCRAEESLLVRHIQHHGFIGTYQAHFHNARVTTGSRKLVRNSPAWKDQLRNSFRVPFQLIAIDWIEIWRLKRRRGLLLKTLPCYVGIVLAHTIGEIVGLYRGPGRSADHID